MRLEVLAGPAEVGRRAAAWLAAAAREAVAERGRFTLAVSGGRAPWPMFDALAGEDLPWEAIHLFQVDERAAPAGHAERNATALGARLLDRVELPPANLHLMPVEARDLEAAAGDYARALATQAGSPAVLDVAHLGIGTDGHTASLVPDDPVLAIADRDVATTGSYQGRRRMTLTFPALDRARRILWIVTGAPKAEALAQLVAGDRAIPAGRVRATDALVLADAAAAGRFGGAR